MSMFKSVKVKYPKKKIKVNELKVIGVPEPVRETMYDILMENFNIAGRRTFLQRIIYIGEHCFLKYEGMVNFFSETVTSANHHRRTLEKLTGILIKYQKHFIHFLEGDEDAIYEHIRLLYSNDQFSSVVENVKLLAIIHHINCRFISKAVQKGDPNPIYFSQSPKRYSSEWMCISGTPPQLLEKIDPTSSMEVTGNVTYGCILKLYDILGKLNKVNISISDSGEKSTEDMLKSPEVRSSSHSTSSSVRRFSLRYSKLAVASRSKTSYADPVMLSLPEIDTLHFLISTPHTKYLIDVLTPYRTIEQRDIYKDKVWPIAADFIPYDVYSKGYDISTVFPKPGSSIAVETTADDGISMLLWEAEGEDADYTDSKSNTEV